MSNNEKIKKKLYNALKLSGYSVKKDFCAYIVDSFSKEDVSLEGNADFDVYFKSICNSLEKQCLMNKSIEKHHIERVVEIALNLGYDKQETTFNVIDAFNFPKFIYDPDRKLYLPATRKATLLSDPNSKTDLFVDRYSTILQRTVRNFKNREDENKLTLQTVDSLLTKSCVTLNKTVILGSLLQVSEGKYYLEDPSGIVELDLTHTKYYGGFFVENSFVLVDGYYEDKILRVASVLLPPGEEYADSVMSFGNLNYFGGSSMVALRNSQNLEEQLEHNQNGCIYFLSDVWLDHPQVFEKLDEIFTGVQDSAPIAFVFMAIWRLLNNYTELIRNSKFVFVPGMTDPCNLHIIPRFSLPKYITEDFKKLVPNAIFATNPCRLQSYTREIALFRADVLIKMTQGSLYKPEKEDRTNYVIRTIISQGHLSPFSLNASTVHWDFDYTLRLFPLPNLIVLGDKTESYQGEYKGCQIINPGPFCDGFNFICYTPFTNQIEECHL
ncbi:hypothetical protein FQR65_LT07620 [Abscondita terminalis]|nr:hypothetical protein FQR65_LT07620 [Abscondita terminalis]